MEKTTQIPTREKLQQETRALNDSILFNNNRIVEIDEALRLLDEKRAFFSISIHDNDTFKVRCELSFIPNLIDIPQLIQRLKSDRLACLEMRAKWEKSLHDINRKIEELGLGS